MNAIGNHPILLRRIMRSAVCVLLLLLGVNLKAQSQVTDTSSLLLENEKPVAQCVPFAMPDVKTLRNSPRKVFAHYFVPFPISVDNKPADQDQYVKHIMNPNGFGKRYFKQGGKTRQRPLPRPVRSDENWLLEDMKLEVARGANLGMDGFIADIVSDTGVNWERYLALMQAATQVDPGFKIMLMAGMPALFRNPKKVQTPQRMADMFLTCAAYPSAYRTDDGRLVISAFRGNDKPASWWKEVFAIMQAKGESVYFVPLIQPWWDDEGKWQQELEPFLPIVDGISTWGPRWASAAEKWQGFPSSVAQYNKISMSPVGAQDMRAKSMIYWEARNTQSYRKLFEAAIKGNANWIQLITWNDYSEATEISPSTGTQFSLYDLTAYYITWFKQGKAPTITDDVIYYSHRKHSLEAKPDPQKQPKLFKNLAPDAPCDEIECLVFAKAPATLSIAIQDTKWQFPVTAGLNEVRIPVQTGTPIFTLRRDDKVVATVKSAFEINNDITYQNMLYHGGSSNRPVFGLD
ncbi:MAG: hypothetical protein CMJ19_09865 [Phycisphaeraceae bacterium]|nr:hypothetical protein [Phycisphaeraceae bacterium]